MTDQTINEICKSFAYGVDINEMSEGYGITVEELEKIKSENTDKIEAIIQHYKEMEG